MRSLSGWILDRMTAYHGGGVPYEDAARFTLGEMEAMYSGNHRKHGRQSPRPRIPYQEALPHSEAVLIELEAVYKAALTVPGVRGLGARE